MRRPRRRPAGLPRLPARPAAPGASRGRALTTKRRANAVDEQRQHEQHEPGGEQRRAVQALGLAELVGDHRGEAVALAEQVVAQLGSVADQDRHGDRLADRAAEAEHRPADDPRAAVGQHGDADHLPAGRPQPERRLLVVGGHRRHHLPADRADDRQDHDREDEPGDEVVGDRHHPAADERDERQPVGHPLLGRLQLGGEEEDAPQAVHDRGHGGEQLDQHRQRCAQAQRAQLGRVDRGGHRHRHADQQRQRGGDERSDQQRQRPEVFGADVPVVAEHEAEDAFLFERGSGFAEQSDEEEDDQREDERRERGQPVLEHPVGQARER